MPSGDGNFLTGAVPKRLGIELHFPISQVAIGGTMCGYDRMECCRWAVVRRNNVCAEGALRMWQRLWQGCLAASVASFVVSATKGECGT